MLAVVQSATVVGPVGRPVAVEVHISSGLPGFTIVGLPDTAVRESRDRVRAALLSSGLPWPRLRVTVNLAPSGMRKGGAGLDLPIAVGVLVATGEVPASAVAELAFVGELALDGAVRHVPAMVPLADAAQGRGVVVPEWDVRDAAIVRPGQVRVARNLRQMVDALVGREPWPAVQSRSPVASSPRAASGPVPGPDLADVRGQRLGRRALEIAAAGRHHLLMVGPPGSGKTMLAERLVGLLPDLSVAEAIDTSRIYSAAGLPLPEGRFLTRPPFRAPHHGASAVALIGGGSWSMRPGEVSLATHGVLFLDEMGEFPATVLDALRQPLEEGVVRVSRARATVSFPASFLLVGAMNPCPCGGAGPLGSCRCSPAARARTVRRLSGPLLDRFDLVVNVSRPDADELMDRRPSEPSAAVAARVADARRRAGERGVGANAFLSGASLEHHAPLTATGRSLLDRHVREGRLSARGLSRVRRVARTVADLDGCADAVDEPHVAEALALRAARQLIEVEAS